MEVKEQIKNILSHHLGKENAISSSAIDMMLGGLDYDSTNLVVRQYIKELLYEGLPIGSNNTGYYIITNDDEFQMYIDNLNSRIKNIQDRQLNLIKNYTQFKNK